MMKLPAMIKTLNGDSNIYNKNLGFSMSCTLLGQGHKTTLFPDSCVGLVLNEKKINDLNILFATKENFGSTVYFESNRTDIGLTKDISKKGNIKLKSDKKRKPDYLSDWFNSIKLRFKQQGIKDPSNEEILNEFCKHITNKLIKHPPEEKFSELNDKTNLWNEVFISHLEKIKNPFSHIIIDLHSFNEKNYDYEDKQIILKDIKELSAKHKLKLLMYDKETGLTQEMLILEESKIENQEINKSVLSHGSNSQKESEK